MDGIVLPDARSCDEYFQCQGGQMTRQRCRPGTLFDLNLYYCSIEHAVNCGARTKPVAVRPPNSPDAPPSPESHHSVSIFVKSRPEVKENLFVWRFAEARETDSC